MGSKRTKSQSDGQHTGPAGAPPAPPTAPARRLPMVPITIGFVVLVVAIALIAGAQADRIEVVDGQVSRIIATVDECAEVTFPIANPQGHSIEQIASTIFDAMAGEGITGVGTVTIFVDNPRVLIDYCQSHVDEARLRQIIQATGYLGQ